MLPLILALLISVGVQELLWRRLTPFLKHQGHARIERGFSPDHLLTVHYLSAGHRLLFWYRVMCLASAVLLLLTVMAGLFWLLGRTA